MQRLKGKVAVVTGASRSIGRGAALVLSEEGATVYATGRSVRGEATRGLPRASIEDTAERVEERGGVAMAEHCDHTVDSQVQALFERAEREQGRLDILVTTHGKAMTPRRSTTRRSGSIYCGAGPGRSPRGCASTTRPAASPPGSW